MKYSHFLFPLPALFLLIPAISFAATGILEIHSDPSGAQIWIDDVEEGKTPYQNLEAPAGKRRVKAFLSPEYPPQIQEVEVDERSPKVIMFKFVGKSRGKFTGQEIISTATKYKGSVTFASIPTGASVLINGEPINKPAPIGYADVEVGTYTVAFQLEGRTLSSSFNVIQGKTVKLIADFRAGKVINRGDGPDGYTPGLQAEPKRNESAEVPQAGQKQQIQPKQAAAPPVPALATQPTGTRPLPAGIEPYGELLITVNVRRDARLAYSDYFDLSFPKLPVDSLSGPMFASKSTDDEPATRDNFEYMSDASGNTRRFAARIHFSSRDKRTADEAKSSVMTVREGTYDLTVGRQRIEDDFYSVKKVVDEKAREKIEIVRGARLTVEIDGAIGEENKLRYEIKRSYADLGKGKKSPDVKPAAN